MRMIQVQTSANQTGLFQGYDLGGFFDEMFDGDRTARSHYARLFSTLGGMTATEFRARCELADLTLVNQGITFTVYGDSQGVEKPFPVDLVPRIVPAEEWRHLDRGLKQRVRALNLFLHDIYHEG